MEGTVKTEPTRQYRATPKPPQTGDSTFVRAPGKLPARAHGALDHYLRQLHGFPVLTRVEEIEIGLKIRAGDREAVNRLVECNLRFVVKIAREYASYGMPVDDLINEGNIGLLEAAERFDPSRGVKFISWAIWWVRKAIRSALTEQLRIVRIPLSQIRRVRLVHETASGLRKDLGREPTADEIAARLPKEMANIEPVLLRDIRVTSLDGPISGPVRETLDDALNASARPSIESELLERESRDAINALCGQLDERERAVISYRFGLNGNEKQTLREIGERIGLTRESVRQIEFKAITRLRRRLIARAPVARRIPECSPGGWNSAA